MFNTNIKALILTVAVTAVIAAAGGSAQSLPQTGLRNTLPTAYSVDAETAGIADWALNKITPEAIRAYEEEIAGEPFISSLSADTLARMAKNLGVEVRKLKALMLLKDLAGRTGADFTLKQLAERGDWELIKLARKYGKAYYDTLSKEERDVLKDKFKEFL